MRHLVAAAFAVVSATGPASADGTPPKPAPALFSTNNYQLTFRIPPGLYRCPYPANWVGSDHGVFIYLAKPAACEPSQPVAMEADAQELPSIAVYYEYNTGEIEDPGGGSHTPRTAADLLRFICPGGTTSPLAGLTLLGAPATGCVQHRTGRVEATILAPYTQNPGGRDDPPDSDVSLHLATSPGRLRKDLAVLGQVAGSLVVCYDARFAPVPRRRPCPRHSQW